MCTTMTKDSPSGANGVEEGGVEKLKNTHFTLHHVAGFRRGVDPYAQVRIWTTCLLQVIGH